MKNTPLETAIAAVGSAKTLAEKVGVTPMAITQWKTRGVPAHRVRSVVNACGGVVSAFDLRPDIFLVADA
ncbi:YdaS family helix-turn-helix protein [Aquipseudomonas campi]